MANLRRDRIKNKGLKLNLWVKVMLIHFGKGWYERTLRTER